MKKCCADVSKCTVEEKSGVCIKSAYPSYVIPLHEENNFFVNCRVILFITLLDNQIHQDSFSDKSRTISSSERRLLFFEKIRNIRNENPITGECLITSFLMDKQRKYTNQTNSMNKEQLS
jgi:hypothetical protein